MWVMAHVSIKMGIKKGKDMSCLLLKMFLLCLWLKSSVCRCRFICIVAKFNNTKTKLNTWETYNWRQQAQSIMFETPTCYWIRFEEMNKQNELSDKQYHVHIFPQTYSKMKEQFKCTFCTIRILFFWRQNFLAWNGQYWDSTKSILQWLMYSEYANIRNG